MNRPEEIHPKMYLYRRIVAAKLYIDEHYAEAIDLEIIADQASFSKFHFLRLFKQTFGQSPHQYLTQVRIRQARNLLKSGANVKEVCYAVGFESIPSFVHLFKTATGSTPLAYRNRAQELALQSQHSPLAFVPNCFAENFGWNS